MYVCACIACICIYVYVWVCMCVYMYVWVYMYMHWIFCMYSYVYVCICTYMYICACMCMYAYPGGSSFHQNWALLELHGAEQGRGVFVSVVYSTDNLWHHDLADQAGVNGPSKEFCGKCHADSRRPDWPCILACHWFTLHVAVVMDTTGHTGKNSCRRSAKGS